MASCAIDTVIQIKRSERLERGQFCTWNEVRKGGVFCVSLKYNFNSNQSWGPVAYVK